MATISVSYDGVNLVFSDRGHTNASPNEVILWVPGPGVAAITNIQAKPDSPVSTARFWSDPPHQTGVNFKGTIASDAVGTWEYGITCNVGTIRNPVPVTVDPKIQVISR